MYLDTADSLAVKSASVQFPTETVLDTVPRGPPSNWSNSLNPDRSRRGFASETLTWPGDAAQAELAGVIDLEVLLDDRPFCFARAVRRAEEVLGIDLIIDPLVAGEADAGYQDRDHHEVSRMVSHHEAQFVERSVQEVVHAGQILPHL